MKSFYIDKTNSLSQGIGEIYVYFTDCEGEDVELCFDAYELFRDLPNWYYLVKDALEKEEEHISSKYKELLKDIIK